MIGNDRLRNKLIGSGLDTFGEYKNGSISGYTDMMIDAYDGTRDLTLWVQLKNKNFLELQGSYLVGDENNVFDEMISTFKFI